LPYHKRDMDTVEYLDHKCNLRKKKLAFFYFLFLFTFPFFFRLFFPFLGLHPCTSSIFSFLPLFFVIYLLLCVDLWSLMRECVGIMVNESEFGVLLVRRVRKESVGWVVKESRLEKMMSVGVCGVVSGFGYAGDLHSCLPIIILFLTSPHLIIPTEQKFSVPPTHA